MADFKLTVRIDTSASYGQMMGDIVSLTKRLNTNPIKLKVRLDQGSVNTIRTQLETMYKHAASGTTSGKINTSGVNASNNAIKQNTQLTRENANAAKAAAAANNEYNNSKSRGAAIDSKIVSGTRQYNESLKKIDNLIKQITVNTDKWTAASKGKTSSSYALYKSQIEELQTLRKQLVSGTISTKQFNDSFSRISSTASAAAKDIAVAGENTRTFGDRIAAVSAKFATWFGITNVIMMVIRTCKKMVSASIDIQDSMTQIQIVTGATDIQMKSFLTESTALAKELGKTITDVASSIETFSRLGYNIQDASSLAEYANILSNIANTDVDTATTGLTSIIKGYGMDVSDAEHIADVLVKVGQEYAISAEELMAAFQRGGAALAASGTDFEKSAALFAATNASLQNAESVGTMWKTVSARIRGAATELEELGEDTDELSEGFSKYRDEVMALSGVDIMFDENTYKDPFEIFVELAKVWDSIESDTSKSRIAEILGGTRQLSGIMSTITNINDAIGAYEGALNSAGTATKANDLYMQTASAHIGQFKAAFQEMSSSLVDAGFITGIVDFGTGVLNVITAIGQLIQLLGGLNTVLITTAGIIALIKAESIVGFITSAGAAITGLITKIIAFGGNTIALFSILGEQIALARTAGAGLFSSLITGITNTSVLFSSATLAVSGFIGAVIAIAAVVGIIDALTTSLEEAKEAAEKSFAAYEETIDEISSLSKELKELDSRMKEIESNGTIDITTDEEYNRLKAEKEELEELLQLKRDIAKYENREAADDANTVLTKEFAWHVEADGAKEGEYAPTTTATGDIIDRAIYLQEEINKKTEEHSRLLDELNNTPISKRDETWYNRSKQLEVMKTEISDLNSQLETEMTEIEKQYNTLLTYDGNEFDDTIGRIEDLFDGSSDHIDETSDALVDATDATEEYETSLDSAKKRMTSFSEYQDKMSEAIASSTDSTGLSIDEIESLISAYGDLEGFDINKLFEETASGIHLNSEELERLNALYEEQELAKYTAELEDLHKQIREGRANGEDTSALELEAEKVELLIGSYEGLTSAYNKWLRAKDSSNERDMYASIGESYDEMQQAINEGWYGDDALNSYLDLLLSAEKRTGDAANDFKKLEETIDGTSHSLLDYWKYDKDNNLVTDGLFDFLDDVNKKFGDSYAKMNENGDYEFNFDGDKLQEVADGFGTTTDVVEMFMRALIDAGAAVNLADVSELERAANVLKEFQSAGKISEGLDLDIDVDYDSMESLQSTIDDLKDERLKIDPEIDPEIAKELDILIAKCEEAYYFRLNIDTDGALDKAIGLVGKLKEITSPGMPLRVHPEFENLHLYAEELASLPTEVQVSVGIYEENAGSVDGIIDQLNSAPDSINVPVNYTGGTQVEPKVQETTVNYNLGSQALPTDKYAKVNYALGSQVKPNNYKAFVYYETIPGKSKGTAITGAYAGGSIMPYWNSYRSSIGAYARGNDWTLPKSEKALVNEVGTESIVRDGKWFTIPGGAHIEQLKKGDIIFSAAQTAELIRTGKVISGGGHGRIARASGTAFNTLNAYEGGSGASRRENSGNSTSFNSKSSNKSSSNSSNSSASADDAIEKLDWIEVSIDRIERLIDNLDKTASATYKNWSERNKDLASELENVRREIELQEAGYKRYLQEAESVGLSENYKNLVKNGTIDIESIGDESLRGKIDEYTEWYEKALECQDAVIELQDDIAELARQEFDNVIQEYEDRISTIEHQAEMINGTIDQIEAKGYMVDKSYYQDLLANETQNLGLLQSEYDALIAARDKAMAEGNIEKYSEEWYSMTSDIYDVEKAIQEANTSIIEFGNNIRDLEWEIFDKTQELSSRIQDESDFLIDLMSNDKMYNDDASITDQGRATLGLHAVNFNAYMAQADEYAKEIANIEKELVEDPFNRDLLDRKNELIDSHRDMITSAEEEKQAIKDLMSDGYDALLDYMSKLVDKRKDMLKSAKDMYDYEKNISKQTKEIATLEKQLMAYSGDNSEENRSTIQKLKVSLEEAKQNLEETEYDKFIKDQEQMLDAIVNETEEWIDERLSNVDALISESIESTNKNAEEIKETLIKEAAAVGTTLSDEMNSIWSNNGAFTSVVSMYGDNFGSQLTTTNNTLNSIKEYVASMASVSEKSENEASTTPPAIQGTNSSVDTSSNNTTNSNTPKQEPTNATNSSASKGDFFVPKKFNSSKSRLDIDTSIVDRLKYNDFDSSFSVRKNYYAGMGLGSASSYTGSASQNISMLRWMKNNGFAKGGTIGKLLKSSGEDGFVLARTGEEILSLEKIKAFRDAFMKINPLIDSLKSVVTTDFRNINNDGNTNNYIEMNISLPNVRNYEDFKYELQHDKSFEKIVQHMAWGATTGKNSLGKYAY